MSASGAGAAVRQRKANADAVVTKDANATDATNAAPRKSTSSFRTRTYKKKNIANTASL
jgi:hypothetical protein